MDYDGDGTTDFTVYANGAWHAHRNDGSPGQTLTTAAGIVPLRGNFGGDLTEEPATYSSGNWSIYSFTVHRHARPPARYFAFGEEISPPTQDIEMMKFTGHERDLADPSGVADDLDYMHARFYNQQAGRFLGSSGSCVGRTVAECREALWKAWKAAKALSPTRIGALIVEVRSVRCRCYK